MSIGLSRDIWQGDGNHQDLPMPRALLLPVAFAAFIIACPAIAAPAMWRVSDQDSRIWLFGSLHVMPEGQEWQTPAFDQVLSKAERVYLETDVSVEQQAIIGAEAFARGIYTDGTLLTDLLDDDQETLLRNVAADVGLPLGPVLAMRPWLATQALTAPVLLEAGFLGDGVELQVLAKIGSERMAYFETGSQQLDILANGPEDVDIEMLMQTLEAMHLMEEALFQMLDMWTSGDVDQLDEMMMAQLVGVEGFADRLLYERNVNWLTPIRQMLADNEANLIIVGAAHLAGERGVPALLEQAGYTVERVQ